MPSECPCCGAGLWWHGYTFAYFDNIPKAVILRRLRCPSCKSVHRLRPKAFWSRFRYSIQVIRQVLDCFIKNDWQSVSPGSRQRLCWQRFRDQAKLIIGMNWGLLSGVFDLLVNRGQIPVSSVILFDLPATKHQPTEVCFCPP